MATTKKTDVINAQVMADAVSAKIPAMIRFTPFAQIDTTLTGVAGDTITVPVWNYVGEAADFNAELGTDIVPKALTASSVPCTIKCAAQSISIYQTAVNASAGDPVGQAEIQLAKAVAGKVDSDVYAAALGSSLKHTDTTNKISYDGIVDAVAVLNEEEDTEKVMFVNPAQIADLRKTAGGFVDKSMYQNNIAVTGEIGMVAGVRIVPSNKVVKTGTTYKNPVIQLGSDNDSLPAVTIFMKKDAQLDHEWLPKAQRHDLTIAEYYGVALTNESKVVVAEFKA